MFFSVLPRSSEEIKRLRLCRNTCWGFFFVKFELKQLPDAAPHPQTAVMLCQEAATGTVAEQLTMGNPSSPPPLAQSGDVRSGAFSFAHIGYLATLKSPGRPGRVYISMMFARRLVDRRRRWRTGTTEAGRERGGGVRIQAPRGSL